MTLNELIAQREERMARVTQVDACKEDLRHDKKACKTCRSIAAYEFLVSCIDNDFKRQVAEMDKKTVAPGPQHRDSQRLAELHERLSKFVPKDGPSTQTTIDYYNK